MSMTLLTRLTFLISTLLALPSFGWACASCGCTLSSDWEYASSRTFKLDLRYDYVNQNQLRSGTSKISNAEASQRMNNGEAQEVELYTKNDYLTATAEYSITPSWRVQLSVPYIMRHHSSLGTDSDGTTPANGGGAYTSNTSNLGDAKVLGRYQGLMESNELGLIFGMKLPTGRHDLKGTSTDPSVSDAIDIDRGLQPGTGTTDLILGLSFLKAMSKNWDAFADLLYQTAMNSSEKYRPGDGYNLNVGWRYLGSEIVVPQLQLNLRYVKKDSGESADTISTGGSLVYLSPGVVVPVHSQAEVYAFLQAPLYQNVQGVQVTPTYTASVGARYMF